ncbi:hypothetical protein GO499_04310 [Algicella marina]|uniref:Uncharacterized protein n=2 Tax=Algicella marina TaxID=2683284 RepID=A0A6P1T1R0_9RHOB|nr:hypothetical protein GO499_04310 [Algicella marina]
MNSGSVIFVTPAGTITLILPAIIFLGIVFLGGAPSEWARGALTCWLALVAVLIAGIGIAILGSMVGLAVLVAAMIALVAGPGGVTALALASFTLFGLLAAHHLLSPLPIHWSLLPSLTACGIISTLKSVWT